jgi:hypothetical protein
VFDSEWIDIAVGVVLVWFLLAVTVAVVNELINRLLAVRAKQLWHALAQILDGAEAKGLVVTTLRLPGKRLETRPRNTTTTPPTPGAGVTFVPSAPAPSLDCLQRFYATDTIQALENHPKAGQKTRINHIPTSVFSQAIIEMATVGTDAAIKSSDVVARLPEGRLKNQLRAISNVAQDDMKTFRDGVEEWFDGQMARLTAIYRSQVRLVVTVIGVVIAFGAFALGLRVDSLRLVSDLQRNENLRTAYASTGTAVAAATNADLAAKGCPPDGAITTTTTAPDIVCVANGLGKVKGIDVSFARAEPSHPGQSLGAGVVDRLSSLYDWRRIVGLLVTIAAIGVGAPFWWDVLRRLVGLRKPGGSTADNG